MKLRELKKIVTARGDRARLRIVPKRLVTAPRKSNTPEKLALLTGPNNGLRRLSRPRAAQPASNRLARHVEEANTLRPSDLKRRYESTYTSWRNMKQRVRAAGLHVAPEFEAFANFLRHMGPRPGASFTLDRLDPKNPAYGPGLCRWIGKEEQSNNRSVTIYIGDDKGVRQPLTRWARLTGQNANTMRKRLARGWSEADVVAGVRRSVGISGADKPSVEQLWPGASCHHAQILEECYSRSISLDSRCAWLHKQTAHLFNRLNAIIEPFVGEPSEEDEIMASTPAETRAEWDRLRKKLAVITPIVDGFREVERQRQSQKRQMEILRRREILNRPRMK